MITLGADVGYTFTKWANGPFIENCGIIRSTYREGAKDLLGSDDVVITLEDGRVFTVGGSKKVSYTNDIDKVGSLAFLLPMLAAIGKSMKFKTEDINLVTGLPISYYKIMKDDLKKSLEGQTFKFKFNTDFLTANINKVLIYPQAAGQFILTPELFQRENTSILVIDNGGHTCDCAEFKGLRIIDFQSFAGMGMLDLYTKVLDYLKSKYKREWAMATTLDAEDAVMNERVIVGGDPTRHMEDIEFIRNAKRIHAEGIITEVRGYFKNYDNIKKIWTGGGSYVLKEFLPGEVKVNSIYDNCRIFHRIGVEKLG